jgi:hypothetical protein
MSGMMERMGSGMMGPGMMRQERKEQMAQMMEQMSQMQKQMREMMGESSKK